MQWIDPNQLPEFTGAIERFIGNTVGEIEGMLVQLDTGRAQLVIVSRQISDQVQSLLRPGDHVIIRGLRPRDANVIAALLVRSGTEIEIDDNVASKMVANTASAVRLSAMRASGRVRLTLFTHKGKPRGALLEDGTVVRIPLQVAQQVKHRLSPGMWLDVRGTGAETKYGRVIDVHHFASTAANVQIIRPKRHQIPKEVAHSSGKEGSSIGLSRPD